MRMGMIVAAATLVAVGAALFMTRDRTVVRLASTTGVSVKRNIAYVPAGGSKQQLDLYLPEGKAGFPMVVFVHGGYWTSGDRNYLAPITGLYGTVGRALAARGIGTAVISYRLVPDVAVEDQIGDVRSAFVWVKEHAAEQGGNPDRVFLMGHSAGAHLVNMLTFDRMYLEAVGRTSADIRGTITLSGFVDLVHMRDNNDAQFNNDVTFRVFGTDETALVRYTPGTHVHAGLPPYLVLLGERDFPWLLPETTATLTAMGNVGLAPEHAVVPVNRHMDMVLRFGARNDNVTERVVSFVERLK